MRMRRTAFWHPALLAIGLSAILARSAAATPLLFHLVGYGNGSIDGIAFTNAQLSINARADSGDRQPLIHTDGFTVNNGFANATIAAGGKVLLFGPFDIPTRFFVNNDLTVAGFSHATGLGTIADGVDLFHVEDAAFATWDFRGQLAFFFDADHGQFLQWAIAPVLIGGHTVVFDTAPTRGFVSTTPEPTIVVFFGTGVAAALRRLNGKRRRS